MGIKWKFWSKSNDDGKKPEEPKVTPQQENKPEGEKGPELSHAFLDSQIEQKVSDTKAKLAPVIEEIQKTQGEITTVTNWYSSPKNLTDLVLRFAKSEQRPSKKDVLYSNILTEGARPDESAGDEYHQRLDEYIAEEKPELGFLKKFKKSSITTKQEFATRLDAVATSVIMDANQARDGLLEDLQAEKQTGYEKIRRLYDFYIRILDALDKGDIDSMLDISKGRIDDAVNRILEIDLSDIHDVEEVQILVKQIGVYDKLIDAAATAKTAEEGIAIINKVIDSANNELEVLTFIEEAIQHTKSTDLAHAYTEFMREQTGSLLPISSTEFVSIDHIVSISGEDSIEIAQKGGFHDMRTTKKTMPSSKTTAALKRVISASPLFVDFENNGSFFNVSYAHQTGHEKPFDLSTTPIFKAVINQNGVTEYTLPDNSHFKTTCAEIEKAGVMYKLGQNTLINLDQVQFIDFDAKTHKFSWTSPGTADGYEWHNLSLYQENQAAAALSDGYEWHNPAMDQQGASLAGAFNTAATPGATIEAGAEATAQAETSLSDAEKAIADIMKNPNFIECPNGMIVNLDQVQSISYGAPAKDYSADDEEEYAANATSMLIMSTTTGEDGFTEWTDENVSEKEAKAFIKKICKYKAFVQAHDTLALNTDHIYNAYVTHYEDEEYDEDGNVVDSEIQPSIIVGFYGRENEYSEMRAQLTEARMQTVIADLAKAQDNAYTFVAEEGYPCLAVNTNHLTHVLQPTTNEEFGHHVEFGFAGTNQGVTTWNLPFSEEQAPEAIKKLSQVDGMQELPNGDLFSRKYLTNLTYNAQQKTLNWYTSGGAHGAYHHTIRDMSEIDASAVIQYARFATAAPKTSAAPAPKKNPKRKKASSPSVQ